MEKLLKRVDDILQWSFIGLKDQHVRVWIYREIEAILMEDVLPLLECSSMLIDRLDHFGEVDSVREEGPIEDTRQAISKIRG